MHALRHLGDRDQLLADAHRLGGHGRIELVGAHADDAHHPARGVRRLDQVHGHARRVLAVEDVLASKGAELGADSGRELGAKGQPLLFLGQRLVVAPNLSQLRIGAPADGEAHVRAVLLEEVRRDRVAELVPGDRDLVPLGVLDRDCKARLHVAHRLPDVGPAERVPSLLERVQQGERKHLLEVGR